MNMVIIQDRRFYVMLARMLSKEPYSTMEPIKEC